MLETRCLIIIQAIPFLKISFLKKYKKECVFHLHKLFLQVYQVHCGEKEAAESLVVLFLPLNEHQLHSKNIICEMTTNNTDKKSSYSCFDFFVCDTP